MVCDLWLVDFDPFCVFLCFKVLLLVIVIMIDGSEKRNCEGSFWVRMFVKSAVIASNKCRLLDFQLLNYGSKG